MKIDLRKARPWFLGAMGLLLSFAAGKKTGRRSAWKEPVKTRQQLKKEREDAKTFGLPEIGNGAD